MQKRFVVHILAQGRRKIDNWGAYIHIFVFTDCKNNRFQKKLIFQNTNMWILPPPQLSIFRRPCISFIKCWYNRQNSKQVHNRQFKILVPKVCREFIPRSLKAEFWYAFCVQASSWGINSVYPTDFGNKDFVCYLSRAGRLYGLQFCLVLSPTVRGARK